MFCCSLTLRHQKVLFVIVLNKFGLCVYCIQVLLLSVLAYYRPLWTNLPHPNLISKKKQQSAQKRQCCDDEKNYYFFELFLQHCSSDLDAENSLTGGFPKRIVWKFDVFSKKILFLCKIYISVYCQKATVLKENPAISAGGANTGEIL